LRRLVQWEKRWSAWQRPGWTATSGLLHLALVGVLVLLLPAAESPRPSLRVRLVEEPKEVAPSLAPPQAPVRPARPTTVARRVARPPASAREAPAQVVVRDEPSVPQGFPDAREPAPVSPATSEPGPAPVPAGGAGALLLDSQEVKLGGGAGAHPGAGEAGALAKAPSEQPSGFFLSSSIGNGTGYSGSGGDAGIGSGGRGLNAGPGGAGEGNGAATGRGGGGVASLGGRVGGGGSGNGSGLAGHLGAIRRQIELAKVYPDAARREGMQGTVELRFRIAGDGTVDAVEVVRSSGHRLLDEVSAQTVRRAAPYPVLAGWIRVPLSYRLDR
jgi:TonB family protein